MLRNLQSRLPSSPKKYLSVFSSKKTKKDDDLSKVKKFSPLFFAFGCTFGLWLSYEVYHRFFFNNPLYDFFRRQKYFLLSSFNQQQTSPEFLEGAALMEREHFFRRLTRYDELLPHAKFPFFS